MKKIERRAVAFELRTEGDSPKIIGHAAVFSTEADLGPFRESIAPGAFAQAIKEDDVRALFNHDPNFVLGRNTAGTLRMTEDESGLAVEIDPPATQWASDLQVSLKRGDISQMSFGFIAKEQRVEKRDGVLHRIITRAQLFDVSPVTFPAYRQTDCAVRSEQEVIEEVEAVALALEAEQRAAEEALLPPVPELPDAEAPVLEPPTPEPVVPETPAQEKVKAEQPITEAQDAEVASEVLAEPVPVADGIPETNSADYEPQLNILRKRLQLIG